VILHAFWIRTDLRLPKKDHQLIGSVDAFKKKPKRTPFKLENRIITDLFIDTSPNLFPGLGNRS
jgi:hypothetical protein